jgi:hypothetical protein
MEHRDTAQALCTVTALIQDVAASWAYYHELASAFDPLPQGLLFHLAGPTDEGIRLVSAWRSAADWHGFQEQRFEPALRRSLHRQPAISLRELRVAHLIGAGVATTDTHPPSTTGR